MNYELLAGAVLIYIVYQAQQRSVDKTKLSKSTTTRVTCNETEMEANLC